MEQGQNAYKGVSVKEYLVETVKRGQQVVEVDQQVSLREGRLRWFGHVKRRPQTSSVRRVEALLVDGLRRKGRPKLRWEDTLKQDMKELLLSEDMTSDRSTWRDKISIGG
ncbi:hypothetical protein Tco_1319742 [Tanacetum coccineum]